MRLHSLALLAVAAGCLGCGGDPNRATVEGTVLLDGKPLHHASLQFWPKADPELGVYRGRTDAAGKYELLGRDDRYAKPGTYFVLIGKDVKKDGKVPDPAVDDMALLSQPGMLKNVLPKKYFDRTTPPFTVEVKPGHNVLPPFELASK